MSPPPSLLGRRCLRAKATISNPFLPQIEVLRRIDANIVEVAPHTQRALHHRPELPLRHIHRLVGPMRSREHNVDITEDMAVLVEPAMYSGRVPH